MANLKRRPESDLNHENWDQEEPPEDQGEFRRAAEEDLRQRRILKPRKRITGGGPGSGGDEEEPAVKSNPFSGFAFSGVSGGAMPSFSFGIPAATASGVGISSAEAGSTGSLFKLAGITPCAEPPTKASADSSTADAPGGGGGEPEAKSISESDGVTEESSNSSSLPWNVSSRQDNEVGSEDGRGGADSRQSETLPSTIQQDLQDSSNDHNSAQPTQNNKSVPTSTAPPDSSESSSSLAPIPSSDAHPFGSFTFGNSFATSESEESSARVSSFQPFASAAVGDVASSSTAVAAAEAAPEFQQTKAPGDPRSPESSGIHLVRSSIEDDSADYENDTTSSSNKLLLSENEASADGVDVGPGISGNENEVGTGDILDDEDSNKEVEADSNEEREAEGVDS